MKKIISFILAMTVVLSSQVIINPVSAANSSTEALKLMSNMGLIEYNEPTDTITRGDLAVLFYDLLTWGNPKTEEKTWEESFFGEFEEKTDLILEDNVGHRISPFIDVTYDNEYYDAVMYNLNYGIFDGVGRGYFKPQENITVIQVLKCVLAMMGYSEYAALQGGYPNGYINVANSLKLTDRVASGIYDEATVTDVANIIVNAFDVNTFEIVGFSNGVPTFSNTNTDTFLHRKMEMEYVEGIVTDNGITAISGNTEITKGDIKIGDVILHIDDEDTLRVLRNSLSKTIYAIYSIAEDTEYDMISYIEKEDDSLVIAPENFVKLADGYLYYDEGNNTKKIKIKDGAYMVYNNEYRGSYSESDFEFNRGSIRIIKSTKNGVYDVIIIESFDSWYVADFDTTNNTIYNALLGNSTALSLDNIAQEGYADILSNDGKYIPVAEIPQDVAIDFYVVNDVYVKMFIADSTESSVKITGAGEDDGRNYIKAEEKIFIAPEYIDAQNRIDYSIGDTINAVLNTYGELIWIKKGSDDYYDLTVGYLIKVKCDNDSGDEECYVDLINTNGVKKQYSFAKKVSFGDTDEKSREKYLRKEPNGMYEALKNYRGVVAFKTNNEGKIDLLELPYYTKAGGEKRLQIIYDGRTEESLPRSDRGSTFCIISDKTWLDSKTTVWQTPKEEKLYSDDTKYQVRNMTAFPSQGTITGPIVSYGVNERSIYGRWVDFIKTPGNDITFLNEEYMVVTDIRTELTADDEISYAIDGYICSRNADMSKRTIYAVDGNGETPSGEICNPAVKATSFYTMHDSKNTSLSMVEKGDIIKYEYATENIYPTTIAILYKAKTGTLHETIGYYNSNYKADKTNPFGLNYNGTRAPYDPAGGGSARKFTLGYLYDINDNIGVVTAQNLRTGQYDPLKKNTEYPETNVALIGQRSYMIDYTQKNITVQQSNDFTNKIRSYCNYGNNCTKVLAINSGYTTELLLYIID